MTGSLDLPPFAISACTTYRSTFLEDITSCRAAGVGGIGLWEYKIPEGTDDELVQRFAASGLTATFCFPNVPSVHYGDALFPEPRDPRARLQFLLSGMRRLAKFEPLAICCLAGPPRAATASASWTLAVEYLREAALLAGELGTRLALEVIRPSPSGSLVSTIPEALAMIDEIDVDAVDVLIDTWHLWDSPTALDDIRSAAGRIAGVQICDHGRDTRGWCDRRLLGQGEIDLPRVLRTLREVGYSGWYELEIFSDDGAFGTDYPDSLWKWDPIRLLRAGKQGFKDAWEASLMRTE